MSLALFFSFAFLSAQSISAEDLQFGRGSSTAAFRIDYEGDWFLPVQVFLRRTKRGSAEREWVVEIQDDADGPSNVMLNEGRCPGISEQADLLQSVSIPGLIDVPHSSPPSGSLHRLVTVWSSRLESDGDEFEIQVSSRKGDVEEWAAEAWRIMHNCLGNYDRRSPAASIAEQQMTARPGNAHR